MLRQIRNASKSWVALLILGPIMVAFVIWGVGGNNAFNTTFSNAVIQAGGHEVSPQQFQTIFNNYRRQLDQQQGRPVTNEELAQYGVADSVLRQLSSDQAFAELLSRIGIRPADQLVAEQIRQERSFFDPNSGRFSPQQYAQLLQQNNMTPEGFEAILRDEVAQGQFAGAIINGLRVPAAYGALTASFNNEARAVSWMVLTPQMVPQPGAPTDAQLTAFMNENAEALRRPEFRVISLVRFSAAEQAPQVQVAEADVVRQFEFRRDSLSQPERRSFVQIPVRDAAAGARVAAALRAGQDPAAVARSVGAEPVTMDAQPRTALPDQAVAAAVFGLQAGQVSDVIRGDLGSSVVKLTAVTPAIVATLEQARPAILQELRARAATERVSQLVERYETAHTAGGNLAEAARAAGVQVATLPPIAADGRTLQGPSNLPPQVLREAFGLPLNGESDVEQAGEGEYYVLRVDRIIAPALPPLAEVRPQLVRVWTVRQLGQALEARATALAERVRRGEALPAVARSVNAVSNTNAAVTRQNAGQSLGQQVATRVFLARPGEVVVGANTGVYLVARVDRVAAPAPVAVAVETAAVRDQLRSAVLREMSEMARTAALARINPHVDMARGRQAVGMEPGDSASGSGAAAPGPATSGAGT